MTSQQEVQHCKLTTDERGLIDKIRLLVDSDKRHSFDEHTSTCVGIIAQKKSVVDQWEDIETLKTLMSAVSMPNESEAAMLVQNATFLRGIFSGKFTSELYLVSILNSYGFYLRS